MRAIRSWNQVGPETKTQQVLLFESGPKSDREERLHYLSPILTMSSTSGYDASNWQATEMTPRERIEFIFNKELMADVHFAFGKDGQAKKKIPAHKFVLSIGSSVFDAMFNGPMATNETEIEILDMDPDSFLCLLRFLYTGETSIGPETVMFTLYAAKKYDVTALRKMCLEYLENRISLDNAFILLSVRFLTGIHTNFLHLSDIKSHFLFILFTINDSCLWYVTLSCLYSILILSSLPSLSLRCAPCDERILRWTINQLGVKTWTQQMLLSES